MGWRATVGGEVHHFADLRELLAKASPPRSGDALAGIAAASARERVAARAALAELPLAAFLSHTVVPYETDEVTRLIVDGHEAAAFAPVASLTVGELRDWLLSDAADAAALAALAPGLMPEMVAAVAKLMRNQDLIAVARRASVVTRFRNTLGLPGRLAVRLQPNHPADSAAGILASVVDGLMYGAGDAMIGVNPVGDSVAALVELLKLLDALIATQRIPTQACVLTHVTNTLQAIERGAPVDLVFQSIGGTEATNRGFGIDLALLDDARAAALALGRGTVGDHLMYFETGQGSALSAGAHHGVDQQTLEARAYAVARRYRPLLVNTVVGFIGPEYLYDGKQIIRAGLEDHFCGKLLGVPMGCDICYTNHAEADSDDMDNLMVLLAAAGSNFMMGVPGADDVMLHYQSTSFHDALVLRELLGLRRAPEFDAWLEGAGITDAEGRLREPRSRPALLGSLAALLPAPSAAGAGAAAPPAADSAPPALAQPPWAPAPDPWTELRRYTPARIALGRAGVALPTAEVLRFGAAHAAARDAVQVPLDIAALRSGLEFDGWQVVEVASRAATRAEYLCRPDLGRRLDPASAGRLAALADAAAPAADLVVVVGDGLSAVAVQRHARALLAALRERWTGTPGAMPRLAPLVVATQARVALADEIGERLGVRAALILIGERPGLSSPDSLGAYLTYAPRVGRVDAERNCLSNIRPEGLGFEAAAARLEWLVGAALRRRLSGIGLSDASTVETIRR